MRPLGPQPSPGALETTIPAASSTKPTVRFVPVAAVRWRWSSPRRGAARLAVNAASPPMR